MNEEIQHPVLGIDHGEARIGLAITDPVGIMAHPLETIQVKTTDPIERIIALVSTRQVKQLVLGLPLRMDGSEGTAAEKIRAFGRELAEKIDLPLYYMDESLTTVAAAEKLHQAGKNAKKQKSIIDQAAAVEILTNWLDQHSPDSFS
jgi:putative Holliday junction resolvase|tara:strand:+ start:410 stop:850 length:441 start_codon:yes stop_codon:yes gene_type:complete